MVKVIFALVSFGGRCRIVKITIIKIVMMFPKITIIKVVRMFPKITIIKVVMMFPKITIIKAVMMFPPLRPICRRRLSRKKRFLKFSSEKHIPQDTSQNQTFIIS